MWQVLAPTGSKFFFFSSRRRHTRCSRDWSSDVCSSDLLGRRREAQEERAAELVVVALVRLDHVAVQRRGLRVAGRLAEPDELAVLYDRDRLARELAGRPALHGGRELFEGLEERAPPPGPRGERP